MKSGYTLLATTALLLLACAAHAQVPAVSRSLFDPDGITPVNGGTDLVLATGDTLAFDTSALTITRNGTSLGSGVVGNTGGGSPQPVALFSFKSLTIPSGVTVTVTGTRPLGLLARENMSVGSVINVSASTTPGGAAGPGGGTGGDGGNLAGSPGGGPGGGAGAGSTRNPGAGGGHGGAGEGGGTVYGDAALSDLYGGSGGGGGSGYTSGFNSYNGKDGGGGGGAVLLLAQNSLAISAAVRANGGTGVSGTTDLGNGGGGSGGAIVLAAPHVSVTGTTLHADGAPGGYYTSPGFGATLGGAGGRIAVYSFSSPPAASTFLARRADISYVPFPFPSYQTTYTASGTVFRSTVDEPGFTYPASLILQPQISGLSVSDATQSTASLRASIRPGAIPATAAFEYGLTTSYGTTVAVPLSPDSGTALQNVSTSITGLAPLTLYHYRLRATNGSGVVTLSGDATFFTPGSPVFSSSADIPITQNGFNATGLTMMPVLNFAPPLGTILTLVNNTSGSPIVGELANIADQGTITLMQDGVAYTFVASYHGGDGNDLVLVLPGPGVLDYTFGKAGRVTKAMSGYDYGRAVAVQPDGKIVVAGNSQMGANHDFVVLRFEADGAPDTSFNVTGSVSTPIGSDSDSVSDMVLQPDGRIILAGHVLEGSLYDIALARFNTNGSLDTTFNGTGKVITDVGSNIDLVNDVILQGDGKIVVVGTYNNTDWVLVRYNIDGSLDSGLAGDSTPADSFGTGGKVITDLGGIGENPSMAVVQADGKIVVVGSAQNGTNKDFAVVRYLSNGNLDMTFNGSGKVLTAVGTGNDNGIGVALLADGKILVCGNTITGSNTDSVLVRYNANGSLDTTFNSTGKRVISLYTNDSANELAIQPDGRIVARIGANTGPSSSGRFALARFLTDGNLDTSFGGTGFVTTNVGGGSASGMAIQSDGQIVLAGTTAGGSTPGDYVVARYEAGLFPEIAVEMTGLGALSDAGHTVDYGIAFPGTPVARTFTVRNSGFSDLTGLGITFSGTGAEDYGVGIRPVAPVAGPTGSTVFTVNFNPGTAGVKTAVMHIASNDSSEASFDITLTGRSLSPGADEDGDGLTNAAEATLAGAGFDPLVDSTALVNTLQNQGLYNHVQYSANFTAGQNAVIADPNPFGLYTMSQLQALRPTTPLLQRNATTGEFTVTLGLEKSTTLLPGSFTPFPMSAPQTLINGAGNIEFRFTVPDNAAFFRLQAQ